MSRTGNPALTKYSQSLRRNMTKEERKLWYDFLKTLPLTFHRQKVLGKCIVDFYCAEQQLVIELDGSQHFSEAGEQSDKERDAWLQTQGLRVLRYSNRQIGEEFSSVCDDILTHCNLK